MTLSSSLMFASVAAFSFFGFGLPRGVAAPVVEVGFEDPKAKLGVFVPAESEGMNCSFEIVADEPHSGRFCGRLRSEGYARFCVAPKSFIAHAGSRYRVSAWVRIAPTTEVQTRQQGFLVRLFPIAQGQQASEGALHVLQGGRVSRDVVPMLVTGETLSTSWTQVEAVVEAPPGIDTFSVNLFMWYVKGDLFVDDFLVEEVGSDVPAAPVTEKPKREALAPLHFPFRA